MNTSGQPNIVFASDVVPNLEVIHDNDTFQVQWSAFNAGQFASGAFSDRLVITNIPEGCPGTDGQDYPVVYNSDTQGDPQDFQEQSLAPGQQGPLMQTTVGPFLAGSYRFTVTLAVNASDTTSYNCKDIDAAP